MIHTANGINRQKLAEIKILNYLFAEPEIYFRFSHLIKEDMFQNYPYIFFAMRDCFNTSKKPSLIALAPLLKSQINFEELTLFFQHYSVETEFTDWLNFLEGECKLRSAGIMLGGIQRIIQDGKYDEIEPFLHKSILGFIDTKMEDLTMRKLVAENIKHIERIQTGTKVFGIPTGISLYDSWTGGLQTTDLNVIAGYTSHGKTTLALVMAYNASVYGAAEIGFFSFEMSNLQIVARLLAIDTGLSQKEILSGKVKLDDLNYLLGEIQNNRIHLPQHRGTTLEYILSMMRYYIARYGCKIFFIDYLQLINYFKKGMNQELLLGEICRILKNFAKENDVCINLLSQLSRQERGGKPKLSSLRGSGQIEEAADNVLFVYRPEVNEIPQIEYRGEITDTTNRAFLLLHKGRNVGITDFALWFNKEIPCIENKHKPKIYETKNFTGN